MRLSFIVTLAAAALAAGCANTTPPGRSELVGERWYVTPLDTYPVSILSVDGRSQTTLPYYVEAGVRRLTLKTVPGGAGFSDVVAFDLEVRPCMRYYVVAVKSNPLDSNFTPRVDHALPLGGSCRPAN